MHRTKLLSGGTLSGASWLSTWPFFKREPSNSNGHLLLLARLHCTGQKSSAPDNCPVRFLARAPTPQSARLHRTERHRTDPLSGALSGAFCTALLRLGYATGQNSPGTVHVRCLPGTFVRCSFSFCFARAVSRPRAPEHRTEATGQNLCPVLCPVLTSAPFSTPFFTLAHKHQHKSVPSPWARVLVFSQIFSQKELGTQLATPLDPSNDA